MTPIITGIQLPDGAREIIQSIMLQTGVPTCMVTSMARTPHEQARIMYDNCAAQLPPSLYKQYKNSIERQYALYASRGDQVVKVYEDNHAILTRDECITLMEAKINALGPETVSKHCCGPDAPYWVIDIAPSSIVDDLEPAFIAACKAHPRMQKVLTPPADPALHLQLYKKEQS